MLRTSELRWVYDRGSFVLRFYVTDYNIEYR